MVGAGLVHCGGPGVAPWRAGGWLPAAGLGQRTGWAAAAGGLGATAFVGPEEDGSRAAHLGADRGAAGGGAREGRACGSWRRRSGCV